MAWAKELKIIRRYLRDPDGNIWSNDLLRELYNQAQNELQQRTGLLEDVQSLELPPELEFSYIHEWEWGYGSGSRYRSLRNQGNNYSVCFRWEVQEFYGNEADIGDNGDAYTYPWEAFIGIVPNKHPAIPFPYNLHSVKAMFHNQEPVYYEEKRNIGNADPSWETRSNIPLRWYIEDESSNQFHLYGRPSTVTWTDDAGKGMVTSVGGDTTGAETGTITQRTGSLLTSESGVAIDVIEEDDNITLVYKVSPVEINSVGDEPDFPQYLNKYIRYRVLGLAYGANTDGRIESLAQYWTDRAALGIEMVKRFISNRHRDKDYRLQTQEIPARRTRRHPRLPSSYPAQ